MPRFTKVCFALSLAVSHIFASSAIAQRGQYCERTNYSAQQITDAVRNSSLRDDLKSTSCSLGGLGRYESGGNKGVYNGSCCTGIFQLNNANVRKYAGCQATRQTAPLTP